MVRLLFVLILLVPINGQARLDPSFEVADLKLNVSGPGAPAVQITNGSVTIRNVTLRVLIAAAWALPVDGVKGPNWLETFASISSPKPRRRIRRSRSCVRCCVPFFAIA